MDSFASISKALQTQVTNDNDSIQEDYNYTYKEKSLMSNQPQSIFSQADDLLLETSAHKESYAKSDQNSGANFQEMYYEFCKFKEKVQDNLKLELNSDDEASDNSDSFTSIQDSLHNRLNTEESAHLQSLIAGLQVAASKTIPTAIENSLNAETFQEMFQWFKNQIETLVDQKKNLLQEIEDLKDENVKLREASDSNEKLLQEINVTKNLAAIHEQAIEDLNKTKKEYEDLLLSEKKSSQDLHHKIENLTLFFCKDNLSKLKLERKKTNVFVNPSKESPQTHRRKSVFFQSKGLSSSGKMDDLLKGDFFDFAKDVEIEPSPVESSNDQVAKEVQELQSTIEMLAQKLEASIYSEKNLKEESDKIKYNSIKKESELREEIQKLHEKYIKQESALRDEIRVLNQKILSLGSAQQKKKSQINENQKDEDKLHSRSSRKSIKTPTAREGKFNRLSGLNSRDEKYREENNQNLEALVQHFILPITHRNEAKQHQDASTITDPDNNGNHFDIIEAKYKEEIQKLNAKKMLYKNKILLIQQDMIIIEGKWKKKVQKIKENLIKSEVNYRTEKIDLQTDHIKSENFLKDQITHLQEKLEKAENSLALQKATTSKSNENNQDSELMSNQFGSAIDKVTYDLNLVGNYKNELNSDQGNNIAIGCPISESLKFHNVSSAENEFKNKYNMLLQEHENYKKETEQLKLNFEKEIQNYKLQINQYNLQQPETGKELERMKLKHQNSKNALKKLSNKMMKDEDENLKKYKKLLKELDFSKEEIEQLKASENRLNERVKKYKIINKELLGNIALIENSMLEKINSLKENHQNELNEIKLALNNQTESSSININQIKLMKKMQKLKVKARRAEALAEEERSKHEKEKIIIENKIKEAESVILFSPRSETSSKQNLSTKKQQKTKNNYDIDAEMYYRLEVHPATNLQQLVNSNKKFNNNQDRASISSTATRNGSFFWNRFSS